MEVSAGTFEEQELETYSSIVIGYINSYVGSITFDRHVRVYPNQKPSMTEMLPDNATLYRAARDNAKRGIGE